MIKSSIFGCTYLHLLIISYYGLSINAQSCSGNGILGCACNFIAACTWDNSNKIFKPFKGSSQADLNPFLPRGLEVFAKDKTKITGICESGSIGIIYDCKNRIPLASTIVITAKQYESSFKRRGKFKQSNNLHQYFQQNDDDYTKASKRILCYKTKGSSTSLLIDNMWFVELNLGKRVLPRTPCINVNIELLKSPVDRGHLVAAHYGLGPPGHDRISETFVFTNSIPQFVKLNRGAWNKFEGRVILWARDNCKGTPVYIIVGSIPSTFAANEKRFFGSSGFSNYLSDIEGYRVNVPAYVWTAACCYLQGSFTKSTFFVADNKPGINLGKSKKFSELFLSVGNPSAPVQDILLFPQWPDCHDDKHFVELP